MLDQLRTEALALIAARPNCTLSTYGPAGIQASIVSCIVRATCIYILIPSATDQLFNLEHELELVLTTRRWQLRGAALVLEYRPTPYPATPADLSDWAHRNGAALVEVFPLRIHIEPYGKHRHRETIDFGIEPYKDHHSL